MARAMTVSLEDSFQRYLCQTSTSPVGIEVASARGCHIWDSSGKRYLDFIAGIGVANAGHSNPAVLRAIRRQAGRYLHVMVYGEYLQEPQIRFAELLAQSLGDSLSVIYFTNSGAEAVEGALKTARKFTGRRRFVAFDLSFHGDTFGALSVGGNPLYRDPFEPLLPDVLLLPFNDLGALDRIDESVAAVIVEPVQAEAGVRIGSTAFLQSLREKTAQAGALLIFDEVITGFGRTGSLFAFQGAAVVPDLIVLAKALGGGLPLGAFAGPPHVMATLSHDPPLSHVTTFGGHPLSCAAGLAAFEYLRKAKLPQQARIRGGELSRGLELLARHSSVVDVRCIGLLAAIEFASPECAARFVSSCLEKGLILNWTLHRDTVVRMAPPLVISSRTLKRAIRIMEAALREIEAG